MADQSDKVWGRLAGGLRRQLGLRIETPGQADEAFRSAPEAPLSPSDIRATMQEVLSGDLATWDPLTGFDESSEASRYCQGVYQARSDDGPSDAERRDMLDELKRRHRKHDEEEKGEVGDSERPNDD